ncbi:MAG: ABC transporter ATP-binding protein [Clostridia bacterium]|nr:ABC transporter ATP-binding protein [Clostridia bacterium]
MMPMRFGPPPGSDRATDSLKPKKPKNLRELPGYIGAVLKGFFSRLFYVIKLVWETKPVILFLMLLLAITDGILPIISALISAELINALVRTVTGEITDFAYVAGLLVLQFAYVFFSGLLRSFNSAFTRVSNEMVINHIKLKINDKARSLDLRNFDEPDFYARLENASQEAGHRPMQILNSAFSIVSTVISVSSFVVVLLTVSSWAPLVIAVLAIPSAVVNFIFRKKNVSYMRFRSKERRQMNYYSELVTGKDLAKEVRIFGLADYFIDKFKEAFANYFKGLKNLIIQENSWHAGLSLVSGTVNCLLALYIAYKVFLGELQVGDYSLYIGALNSVSSGVASLIGTTATIYEGSLFIENLIVFLKEKITVVPTADPPIRPERGAAHTIRFDHVSFRYPGQEKMVIDDVSFTLSPGETCVLVGLNGAGKTTLIKLLTRLYDPTEGTIYLDGHDIKEYSVRELYDTFGIIFQDFGKYAFSVSENIAFGDIGDGPDPERVKEAADQSGAADFIEKLPDSYMTPLMRIFEEKGKELSIGQWQKLSIARAFYGSSDILILDEPTASLDPMAEQAVFDKFDSLSHDRTTIFVSHRLSSATSASKILVIDGGRIAEEGTHRELMANKGIYYDLFTTQAGRYINGSGDPDGMDEGKGDGPAPEGPSEGFPGPGGGKMPDPPRFHKTEPRGFTGTIPDEGRGAGDAGPVPDGEGGV